MRLSKARSALHRRVFFQGNPLRRFVPSGLAFDEVLFSVTDLTIVVPTFNEAGNIERLVERLSTVLADIAWEVIFVDDDSPDGTAAAVRDIARLNDRVRCLHRIGRRGLSSACIEGILASSSPYVAVMDADLQHDENLLPNMYRLLREGGCDLVIGSRYASGGGVGDWSAWRRKASFWGTWLSRLLTKEDISDPMSGFFMLPRPVFEGAMRRLSAQGFKILLDLLASSETPLRIKELPYEFRQRMYGESKLDALVIWEFAMLLTDKLVGHVVPVRFALFALIGGIGTIVHMAVLWGSLWVFAMPFLTAQTIAAIVAMTSNFLLNNFFTYADRRLKGWGAVRGLISFYAVCSLGAVANVGVASYLFGQREVWWIAGIAGIVVGSVWNYAVSTIFTWKR